MTERVFVVCPAGLVTGGTEALHQLGDAINRRTTNHASMLYRPFRSGQQIPEPFRRYNIDVAEARSVVKSSVVVLPETSADMVRVFSAAARIDFWWLSVDRFFKITGPASDHYLKTVTRVGRHLYQSEHARQFLESRAFGPTASMSDYLADEYRRAAAHPAGGRRDNIVVYNPVKGWERTEAILAAMNGSARAVPVARMSRNQIRQLLKRAKVYIDFGEHPGKDRLPREAAALGACVVTNRRGSAGNEVDVPIDDEYKIDDTVPGFASTAAAKIAELLTDFGEHQPRFERWRRRIGAERTGFLNDVDTAFA